MANPSQSKYRWPWFVAGGVILFLVASVLWLSVLVQRVKRIKASNEGQTNSAVAPR